MRFSDSFALDLQCMHAYRNYWGDQPLADGHFLATLELTTVFSPVRIQQTRIFGTQTSMCNWAGRCLRRAT